MDAVKSSSVIFTYSEGSDKKAADLIDSILETIGYELRSKDMFYMGVFVDDYDYYMESLQDEYYNADLGDYDYNEMISDGFSKEEINDLKYIFNHNDFDFNDCIKQVLDGRKKKPMWMKRASSFYYEDGYTLSTILYIVPKEEKYTKIANMLTSFLYSTSHDFTYG